MALNSKLADSTFLKPLTLRSRNVSRRRPVLTVKSILSQEVPTKAAQSFANQLEALKAVSKVVADTGEINAIRKFKPVDSTTNPSLVYKAVQLPEYAHFIRDAIDEEKGRGSGARPYAPIADRLAVNMGIELLKIIPGRVSTEVDAHLSFDTQATIDKALRIIDLYEKKGVDTSKRVYIKIASTWEGIRACEALEKQGINCNMTLIFSFAQAAAAADAGASLISPFVGRVLDWYKKNRPGVDYSGASDPGVKFVTDVYKYYKTYGVSTIVMAASFRNAEEIRQLAGCDNITISTGLLEELENATEPLPRLLWPTMGGYNGPQVDLTAASEGQFRKLHEADPMAVAKLVEGVDGFAKDQTKLEELIAKTMAS